MVPDVLTLFYRSPIWFSESIQRERGERFKRPGEGPFPSSKVPTSVKDWCISPDIFKACERKGRGGREGLYRDRSTTVVQGREPVAASSGSANF